MTAETVQRQRAPGIDTPLPGLYGPDGRPTFFSDPAMDRFVAVLLNLAGETWVQEERILALEGRLPDDESGRDALSRAFVQRVFEPLREPRSD